MRDLESRVETFLVTGYVCIDIYIYIYIHVYLIFYVHTHTRVSWFLEVERGPRTRTLLGRACPKEPMKPWDEMDLQFGHIGSMYVHLSVHIYHLGGYVVCMCLYI